MRTFFDRSLLLLLSAIAALIALIPLTQLGFFGPSFEGSSGYAALFFGFPILTVVFALLAVRFAPQPQPIWFRITGWVIVALIFATLFIF